MEIHHLTTADWRRRRAIRLRALRDSPDAFGATLAEELTVDDAGWQARLARPDVATFVAHADGEDIGLVTSAPYGDHAGLFSMWVDPRHRGRGVGEALVRAAVSWAMQQGYERMLLDVGDSNVAAVAFYTRLGFRPTGVTGSLPPPRDHHLEHQRELRLR